MQSWHATDTDLAPHTPQILSTTAQTRAILLRLGGRTPPGTRRLSRALSMGRVGDPVDGVPTRFL